MSEDSAKCNDPRRSSHSESRRTAGVHGDRVLAEDDDDDQRTQVAGMCSWIALSWQSRAGAVGARPWPSMRRGSTGVLGGVLVDDDRGHDVLPAVTEPVATCSAYRPSPSSDRGDTVPRPHDDRVDAVERSETRQVSRSPRADCDQHCSFGRSTRDDDIDRSRTPKAR